MLTSAPFDDWWHAAYGLDVKILSPPHAVLAMGMYGAATGALLWVLAERNRQQALGLEGSGANSKNRWVVLAIGIQLALASVLLTELSLPNLQRTQTFFWVSAAMYPAFLCASAQLGVVPFTATRVALLYMAILASVVWLLPLFSAEPLLAPVYNRVTHMVPPAFPLLLVVPALALDGWFWLWRRRTHRVWMPVRILGATVLFVGCFLPVQWFFSRFLMSPLADNWFFAGASFFPYSSQPGPWWNDYWQLEKDPFVLGSLWGMLGIGLVSATVGTFIGLFFGKVRR
jgi:hypothetical protein